MPLYKHPHVTDGSISVGESSIPVKGGLVELDEVLGREVGWPLATEADIKASEQPAAKAKSKSTPKSAAKKRKRKPRY